MGEAHARGAVGETGQVADRAVSSGGPGPALRPPLCLADQMLSQLPGDRLKLVPAGLFGHDGEIGKLPRRGHADDHAGAERRHGQSLTESPGRRPVDFDDYLDQMITSIRRPGYTEAFAATRPRDTAGTEEAHQRNRRVEFVVVRKAAPAAPTALQPPPLEGGTP